MGNCLKCGSTTKDPAVFCDDCQAVMEQYPVKPGTVAYLLPRPKRAERKAAPSQESAMKARISGLRRSNRVLIFLVVLLSAMVAALAWMLVRSTSKAPESAPIGQNYTYTTPETTADTTPDIIPDTTPTLQPAEPSAPAAAQP